MRLEGIELRLGKMLSIYEESEATAGTFRARQLQAVLKLAPLALLANALNVAVITCLFWSATTGVFLASWALAASFIVWRGFVGSRRKARRSGGSHAALQTSVQTAVQSPSNTAIASPRALRRATHHAVVQSLLWASLPLVIFRSADAAHQFLLVAIMTGMMCAGGFALATVPVAATAYIALLGLGTAGALACFGRELGWSMAALITVYMALLVASVWSAARMFGARLSAEAKAERQSHIVGLLLRDYEENVSNVLWEVDDKGRLCGASRKFTDVFAAADRPLGEPAGVPAAAPVARPAKRLSDNRAVVRPLPPAGAETMLDLVERAVGAAPGQPDPGVEAMRRHFEAGTAFRDVTVATRNAGATRWWAFTARPLLDADGHHGGWRGVASDVTATEEARHRLTWLAHHDPLTGLANRHRFRSYLAELLTDRRESERCSAIICIDLDDFKVVNDTLGHAIGDELLCEVSNRLLKLVRDKDMVARLGGDEFAVVLRDVGSAAEADTITRRLLAGLEAPCSLKGARVVARASIGVALAPHDGRDIDTLLNHADLALYAAKAAGKGQFRAFASQMAERTRRRLKLEQGLRHALERGEMRLVFQPQVNLAQWRVTGFEALLRWWNPELGEVSPAEFIPIAEETGTIQAIGEWVMQQACREAASWPQPCLVSVNVSPVQAMSQDMYAITGAALRASGLPATRLEIEITESVFMTESQAAIDGLCALRETGVRIALDDFGTGYSSLSYLQRFPFDTLKIDRSFVKEIAAHREQRAIVKMIIGLATVLGMRTVAEGVEDSSQLGVLDRYRCETIQGYLVSKPMEARQVSGFLATWGLLPNGAQGVDPGATDMVPMATTA